MHLNVLDFHQSALLLPAWLALLWALFTTTLNHSMAWRARPWRHASLVGGIGGRLSYFAGSRLTGVGFPQEEAFTLALLALIWAVLLPLLHALAKLYSAYREVSSAP